MLKLGAVGKIKPLPVKVGISHVLQLCNGAICQPPHFRVHVRQGSPHPCHRPATARSVVHTDQIFFFNAEIHGQTSNSFVFSRGCVCLLCSFFAASSCARMDGFFDLAVRDFFAFGAFSSALTAAARSVREICSPAFAFASNSPRDGASAPHRCQRQS